MFYQVLKCVLVCIDQEQRRVESTDGVDLTTSPYLATLIAVRPLILKLMQFN